eukprot:CAMPEP_0170200960 /NCGR_PEP_ID=MMETSP0040_2-20121228/70136_1 /TAXON_ID=641309 /ORGANISM="Lotharella oceanica, Strain CCMP622" /LENGTH=119 /DNA_ID=CAMNT_0010451155 /DNA_START=512 /DNA_END=871 /DNA_ORIENTATION=+
MRKLGYEGMGMAEENAMHGHVGSARDFGQQIASGRPKKRGEKWAVYMERLCYFFSRDFFCEKAIAVLMQEDAEFGATGFRKALEALFKSYAAERDWVREGYSVGASHVTNRQGNTTPPG